MEKINLESINSMDGHLFEELIGKLLIKMGFHIEENSGSADGGIDIVAHNYEPIVGGKCIIQCKRYSSPISEHTIRDLYGVVTDRKASKGVLITNSTFTSASIKFAEGKPIELMDGNKLINLIAKHLELADSCKDAVSLPLHLQQFLKAFIKTMATLKKDYTEIKEGLVFVKSQKGKNRDDYFNFVGKEMEDLGSFMDTFVRIINFNNVKNPEDPSLNSKLTQKRVMDFCATVYKSYKQFYFTGYPSECGDVYKALSFTYDSFFADLFAFADTLKDIVANPQNYLTENGLMLELKVGQGLLAGVSRINEAVQKLVNQINNPQPKQGCFIATACYGYDSEEVCILQQARDTYLVKNELGFALVRLYYTISPYIAGIIRNNYLLKQIIRILLKPIVYALKRFL